MQILRSARKKAGFSQMQLATELDMQVRQYQRFEYGEESFSSVNIKTGLKICRILQLDPFDLVLGDSCGTQMIPQTKNKPPGKKKRNHDSWNGRGSYPDPTANEAIERPVHSRGTLIGTLHHSVRLRRQQAGRHVFMTESRWHSSVDECQRRKFF